MRILMLSWEYPPVVVGGLGRHVHAISTALAAQGHDLTVISRRGKDAPASERLDGVSIIRVDPGPPCLDFCTDLLGWTLALNHSMLRAAAAWWPTSGPTPVIHAHDWLVANAAVAMSRQTGAALVSTLHATEAGRHQGWLPGPLNRQIHALEWWLANNSARVVVCSKSMRAEAGGLYDVPLSQITVIPNGIDPMLWKASRRSILDARAQYAGAGPLVVFTGRLEYEKGVHDLIDAVPRLRRRHPGLRVVVTGDGTQRDWLQQRAAARRLGRSLQFAGHLDHDTLRALLGAVDVAVVPSRYEPFGMVALEMAAAGAPLVVAAVGGLDEFAASDTRALTFSAGSPAALADAVTAVLSDPASASRRVGRARSVLSPAYSWQGIATATAATYSAARRGKRRQRDDIPEPPTSNLFTGASS